MIPFLTFIFVMVVTAILFGSWLIITAGKVIWRMFIGPAQPMQSGTGRHCGNPGCRSGNPMHARFCRRCGANLMEVSTARPMRQPQPRFNPANGRGRQVARV
jgi:hypothetical protein